MLDLGFTAPAEVRRRTDVTDSKATIKLIRTDETADLTSILRWGPGSGSTAVIEESHYPVPSAIAVREREPTLGDPDRKKEKPFINGTLQVRFPSGAIHRQEGYYLQTFEGPLSGVYGMDGNQFNGSLQYPMLSTYPKVPPAVNQYPPGISPDLLSQAEVRCLNKLKGRGVDTTLDFGLVWAERAETIRLFGDAVGATLRLAIALKQGKAAEALDIIRDDFRAWFTGDERSLRRKLRSFRKEVKRGARTSAQLVEQLKSACLVWNLGVSPLMADLSAASELLQNGLLTRDFNVRSVSSYGRQINDVEQTEHGQGYVSTQTISDAHYYTVVLVAAPSFSDAALLEALGLTNPAALAWQVTSKTFIVDYFLSVGPWLESLSVPRMFYFHDGSWTQSVKRIMTLRLEGTAGKSTLGNLVLNYARREVLGEFPIPLPPLSFREHTLKDKQLLNTGLVALNTLQSLLGLKVK